MIGPRLCRITCGLLQLGSGLGIKDDHASVAAGTECVLPFNDTRGIGIDMD